MDWDLGRQQRREAAVTAEAAAPWRSQTAALFIAETLALVLAAALAFLGAGGGGGGGAGEGGKDRPTRLGNLEENGEAPEKILEAPGRNKSVNVLSPRGGVSFESF